MIQKFFVKISFSNIWVARFAHINPRIILILFWDLQFRRSFRERQGIVGYLLFGLLGFGFFGLLLFFLSDSLSLSLLLEALLFCCFFGESLCLCFSFCFLRQSLLLCLFRLSLCFSRFRFLCQSLSFCFLLQSFLFSFFLGDSLCFCLFR